MTFLITVFLCTLSLLIETCMSTSSPLPTFIKYEHYVELQANKVDLWWTVNNVEQEITFELHVKTIGWIALGISPAGGMKGADIAVSWIDTSGKVYIQDRHAFDRVKPIIDNTTQDWSVLNGKEKNGWTAIRFKRKFDSCDPMDVPIKSGTNIIIFAYGLVDPDPCSNKTDITYHEDRRGTRMLPLLSYSDPSTDAMLTEFEFLDLRLDNSIIPSTDTTYYCKVFKVPSRFTQKRHAIAHKVLVDSRNPTLIHHLDLFECSSRDVLDDTKLPDGICDEIFNTARPCSSILATSWAIGGDLITIYPKETGYTVADVSNDKYFMIKIHYDNPRLMSNLQDSSGIRFYLDKEVRQNELGYLVFGTLSRATALAIPPKTKRFIVDSYCPPEVTRNLPTTGINILSALPHTHLQGVTVWTKLIRNNKAVQYLFNADAFDFNYQFENRLPQPIKIYPGDSFVTRCIYSTTDKDDMTLGGQRTKDEMCSQTFSYYPLVNDLSACLATIDEKEWQNFMNLSTPYDNAKFQAWLMNLKWTPELVDEWQKFYNQANRSLFIDRRGQFEYKTVPGKLDYEDLKVESCNQTGTRQIIDQTCSNASGHHNGIYTLLIFSFMIYIIRTIYF